MKLSQSAFLFGFSNGSGLSFLSEVSEFNLMNPFAECPDKDLGEKCKFDCEQVYVDCIQSCGDSDCYLDCGRDLSYCSDDCPCEKNCINGCAGCDNPICTCNTPNNEENAEDCLMKMSKKMGECTLACGTDSSCKSGCQYTFENVDYKNCPCQDNCPLGCPCDSYNCAIPKTYSVMALSTHKTSNYPTLIKYNGGKDPQFSGLNFQMASNTEAAGSCSAILNGEFYLFGGRTSGTKRQISKMQGCEFIRKGELSADFVSGACGTYNWSGQERILLCFAAMRTQTCESWDGQFFHDHANTRYPHHRTSLDTIAGNPLAVGDTAGNKAEVYDIGRNTWTDVSSYPFHSAISAYATVTTSQGAMIIGGYNGKESVTTIADYTGNASGWTQIGDLHIARNGHRAIVNVDQVFVVGGNLDEIQTEIWSLDGGAYNIKLAEPFLTGFYDYPELFLVDPRFCKN